MNRSLLIVLGAFLLGAALLGASFLAGRQICQVCVATPPGSLQWLRTEYHLNDAQFAQIEKLHKTYVSECGAMCNMVTEKKHAAEVAVSASTNVTPQVREKLTELAQCRVDCQSRMLRYFDDVSRCMPPEEGRRYLARMRQFALGLPDAAPAPAMDSMMDHAHGTN